MTHTTHTTPANTPVAGPAVRTVGLTKSYGGRTVVDGLDLDVPTGVVSGFVGPNGAGKTTTIRMLLGLVRPTRGEGTVLGSSLHHPPAYLPAVGAMIEGPAFTPTLSAADNLRVLTRLGGLPAARITEVLERVGLRDRGGDRFRSYSLGMKQRLGIAAALLPRPRLLILDEPTNGLDPAGIVQMRELIASFRDEGMTVLVSSHLLVEVEQVADHLVMIRQGRLVYQGDVVDLLGRQSPQVLLGTTGPEEADLLIDVAAALDRPATVDGDHEVTVALPADTDERAAAGWAGELNRRAHDCGVVLTRLEVRRPTLERAFFDLTGATSGDVR